MGDAETRLSSIGLLVGDLVGARVGASVSALVVSSICSAITSATFSSLVVTPAGSVISITGNSSLGGIV